jgi:hypothetical protein
VQPVGKDPAVAERLASHSRSEGSQALENDLQVPDAEDQEAVEERQMQKAGPAVLQHLLVAQDVGDDLPHALPEVPGEVLGRPGPGVGQDTEVPEAPGHEAEGGGDEGEGEERLEQGEKHGVGTSVWEASLAKKRSPAVVV